MAVRQHPAGPAGLAEPPCPAAWNSSAEAARTRRETAPAWPTIRQRTPEVPPQTAGSRMEWPAGPGRQGNDLRRQENMEVVHSGALMKVRYFSQGGCVLPGLNRSGLSQWRGSWWIDHMLTRTRVPRPTGWPPTLPERGFEHLYEDMICKNFTTSINNVQTREIFNLVSWHYKSEERSRRMRWNFKTFVSESWQLQSGW